MKYRKETVKSPIGESDRYYLITRDKVTLKDVARRIEARRGTSAIDTMRIIWNFFEEIIPLLEEGDRIEITDYCTLAATIKKDNKGKPKVGGIQLNAIGALKKALAKIQLKECLNTDKTAK